MSEILVGALIGAQTPAGYPSFSGKTAFDLCRADRI